MLSQSDAARLKSINKKMNCALENCGKNFWFEADEAEVRGAHFSKPIYKGQCAKCLVNIKLTSDSFWFFTRVKGYPKLNVIKTVHKGFFTTPTQDSLKVLQEDGGKPVHEKHDFSDDVFGLSKSRQAEYLMAGSFSKTDGISSFKG